MNKAISIAWNNKVWFPRGRHEKPSWVIFYGGQKENVCIQTEIADRDTTPDPHEADADRKVKNNHANAVVIETAAALKRNPQIPFYLE